MFIDYCHFCVRSLPGLSDTLSSWGSYWKIIENKLIIWFKNIFKLVRLNLIKRKLEQVRFVLNCLSSAKKMCNENLVQVLNFEASKTVPETMSNFKFALHSSNLFWTICLPSTNLSTDNNKSHDETQPYINYYHSSFVHLCRGLCIQTVPEILEKNLF